MLCTAACCCGIFAEWLSLMASLALILLLVVVPLIFFKLDGLKVQGGLRMVVFFTAVGLAYLAVLATIAQYRIMLELSSVEHI